MGQPTWRPIIICALLAIASFAFTESISVDDLKPNEVESLLRTKFYLEHLDSLEKEGILSTITATSKRDQYRKDLWNKLSSKDAKQDELNQLLNLEEKDALFNKILRVKADESSTLSKISGFFTFVNFMWTIAIFIIVIAVGSLIAIYIAPHIMKLPIQLLELIMYLVIAGFIYGGKLFSENSGPFIAFTGCVALPPAIAFSLALHSSGGGDKEKAAKFIMFVSMIVYGATAVWYQSNLIGFSTIILVEGLFGFMVAASPFVYMIGFGSEAVIPRAMGGSFFLMAVYTLSRVSHADVGPFKVFEKGCLFMGTFVYFIGLLITTNRWYYRGNISNNYIQVNILALISGVLAVLLGSMYSGLGYLQGVGGTFFVLMLFDKYSEINWDQKNAVWGLLGLGGLLYGVALFISSHPYLFINPSLL